jgi:hypothetical protein
MSKSGRKRPDGKLSVDAVKHLSRNGVKTELLVTEVFTQIAEFLRLCPISLDAQAKVVGMLEQEVTDLRCERSVSFSRSLGRVFESHRD